MKWLSLLIVFTSAAAFAQNTAAPAEPEFDSLGGNRILLERAKAMEPDQTFSVVQKRAVDRRHRVEFAPEVSGVLGGEALTRARSIGMNAYYHFTPRIAVGAKFNYSFNTLTAEGQERLDIANREHEANPEVVTKDYSESDFQKTEWLGLVNWYPLYGKFSVLDRQVVHFDFYTVAGAGQTTLRSGPTTTYTGGVGMGLWLTQHFTTRFEMRYQTYTAKYGKNFETSRKLDLTVASLQMGWLL